VSELRNFCEPDDEIEALILSAKDYVHPSEDLRPRVVETARIERGERGMQRRFWQVAAIVFLCGMLTSPAGERSESARLRPPAALKASEILIHVEAAARAADPSWEMVESFSELRLRQAEMLRL
jgi:hypothetical protein